MGWHWGSEGFERPGSEPVGAGKAGQEEHRVARSTLLGVGTLACPACDAPVALPEPVARPSDPLGCPFCRHQGSLRDFLSLSPPSRPARVAVHVVPRRQR